VSITSVNDKSHVPALVIGEGHDRLVTIVAVDLDGFPPLLIAPVAFRPCEADGLGTIDAARVAEEKPPDQSTHQRCSPPMMMSATSASYLKFAIPSTLLLIEYISPRI
jgi:hypothetical protein